LKKASNFFPLNGTFFRPYLDGLAEAVEAYTKAVERVKQFRPDNINESIKFFCDMAE
jgi:hypothetical protein